MDVSFRKGSPEYLNDCEEALIKSELGKRYFFREGSAKKAILEGLLKENLHIALNGDVCVGFMRYMPEGIFNGFPYLHIISVKEEYRNKGIGKKMIDFLENLAFENDDKIFLTVSDFNSDAKRFYEKNGYYQVGEIPNLYRNGITERLMMKEKQCKMSTDSCIEKY